MSGDPERAELDAAVLAWMREDDFAPDDARFDALARALFEFQFARCEPFRRLCERRDRTPEQVGSWRDIPSVPTGAFKEMALRSFPAERTIHTFRTSGTATDARGELHLDTLEVYEASLLPSFRRGVLPDLGTDERMPFVVLASTRDDAPDSSLSHMFAVVMEHHAESGSFIDLDSAAAVRALGDIRGPVCVCATAFALVHLIDALPATGLPLAPGSRVMETGGFKGRAREVTRRALYARVSDSLRVPDTRIVNQYGMTELGSQFYDSVLARPHEPRRKLGPPWARARVLDPLSGSEVADGERGVLHVLDLANTGSVLAVQTADLAVRSGDGFDVLGRQPGAEARGCSIAADEMLARPLESAG